MTAVANPADAQDARRGLLLGALGVELQGKRIPVARPQAERRAAPQPAPIPSGNRPAYPPGKGLL